MATTTVTIGNDDDGRRLDRVLRKYLPGLPLSALHRLLRKGAVRVDGRKADAADRISAGSTLTLPDIPDARTGKDETGIVPPKPLRVAFENERILIAVKDAGTLTHGEGSVDEAVRAYLKGTLPQSLSFTPGPLHRLDRGTSGLVAFSKSIDGARRFSRAIAERKIGKRYLAVLDGVLSSPERWEDELERDDDEKTTMIAEAGSGAKADTLARPLANDGESTLALMELGTGRTHQIRVQAAARGHALRGDAKYGGTAMRGGFLLHAYEMTDESRPREEDLLPEIVTAPPPRRFLVYVEERFGSSWAEMIAAGLPSARLLNAIM